MLASAGEIGHELFIHIPVGHVAQPPSSEFANLPLPEVIEALAIHNGVGSIELRKGIAAVLGRLVKVRPETAALVARQFAARSDWSQASWLKTGVKVDSIPGLANRLAVESYLARAKWVGLGLSTAAGGH